MADTRNGFEPPPFTPRWDQAQRTSTPSSYAPPVYGESTATPFRQAGGRHSSGAHSVDDLRSGDRRTAYRPDDEPPRRTGRLDKNPWHWLLLVPIVVPLMPIIYNRIEPTLFGLPFFYWGQLAFAFLASAVIAIVNMKSR